ncbi:hypothetical protein UT300005_25990 [Clostridium sp. CTA-5]
MDRIEIGNSTHIHSWSKFEEPNIKFGFLLKNSKIKLSPINACSQSKIDDKQLIVRLK